MQRLSKTLHSNDPDRSSVLAGDFRVIPSRHKEDVHASAADPDRFLLGAADRDHGAVGLELAGRRDPVAAVDAMAELLENVESEREPGRGAADRPRVDPNRD